MAAIFYDGKASQDFALSLSGNQEAGLRAWQLLAKPLIWTGQVPFELQDKSAAGLTQISDNWQLVFRTQASVATDVKVQAYQDPYLQVTLIGPDLEQLAQQNFQGRKVGQRIYFDATTFQSFAVPRAVLYAKFQLVFPAGASASGYASNATVTMTVQVRATSKIPPAPATLATKTSTYLESSPMQVMALSGPQATVGAVVDPSTCSEIYGPCPPGYSYTGRILNLETASLGGPQPQYGSSLNTFTSQGQ